MNPSPDSSSVAHKPPASGGTPWFSNPLGWGLSLILLVVMLFLLFAPIGPDYYSHRLYRTLWDLGHLPCFALVAYVTVRGLWGRVRLSGPAWILLLSGGALLAGVLVELIQFQVGRSVSGRDLFNDLVGAYLVAVLYPPIQRQLAPYLRRFLRAVLVALLAVAFAPLVIQAYDHSLALRQFPLLASFEHPTELSRWKGSRHERVAQYPVDGEYALRLRFQGEGYEGVSLSHFPGDWRGFEFLELSIYNEGEALRATLRIHDDAHVRGEMAYSDRYNLGLQVESGWNHLRIPLQQVAQAPLNREMDLSKIRNLGLFVYDLKRSGTIYLDDIRLAMK